MRVGPRLALLCLLLLAAAVPVVVVGQSAAEPAAQQENDTLSPESMTMTVQLEADGDARWSITTEFLLENESERRAFEQLGNSFETGDASAAYDIRTFEQAAAAGRDATGREMEVVEPRYNATTEPAENGTVGRLTLTFRWTEFTETSGERLRIGDGFNTTTGTWLPGLTADQTLVVRPPPGYTVFNIPRGVGIQGGTVTIDGPASFEPGYLGQITYEATAPGTTDPNGPSVTPTPGGPDLSALGMVGMVVAGLGALAIGAYVVSRRRDEDDAPDRPTPNADGGADTDDGGAAAVGGAATGAAAAAGSDDDADDEADGAAAADEPDFDLLSDEERVEYLLQQNGGRMKQANIVKETGWSNAKVSQLLSAMDEADRIDKLRIGRENLISLPDRDLGEFDTE